MEFEFGETLYTNPLTTPDDVSDFVIEGEPAVTFPRGWMRLENARPRDENHHANYLVWCPRDFPADIAVSWEFRPLSDKGLAMFWTGAAGRNGEDLFDPNLAARDGNYPQYHSGDINGLHVSYFRRNPSETGFRTCNLRKSHGFHLVSQGADPLPNSRDALDSYKVEVIKCGPHFRFRMNDLTLFHWTDDGETYGPVIGPGKIGIRQMAGLIAEYRGLEVRAVTVG